MYWVTYLIVYLEYWNLFNVMYRFCKVWTMCSISHMLSCALKIPLQKVNSWTTFPWENLFLAIKPGKTQTELFLIWDMWELGARLRFQKLSISIQSLLVLAINVVSPSGEELPGMLFLSVLWLISWENTYAWDEFRALHQHCPAEMSLKVFWALA